MDFLGGSVVKNLPANVGDTGWILGSGRSPGKGHGNPLQYSCLQNPMDRDDWWATVQGVTKSLIQLSIHAQGDVIFYSLVTKFWVIMGINCTFSLLTWNSQILSPLKMLPHLNCEYSLLFKVSAGFWDFLSTSKVASLGPRLLREGSLSLHSPKNQSFVQGKTSPATTSTSIVLQCWAGLWTSYLWADGSGAWWWYFMCSKSKNSCLCVHTTYLAPFVYI